MNWIDVTQLTALRTGDMHWCAVTLHHGDHHIADLAVLRPAFLVLLLAVSGGRFVVSISMIDATHFSSRPSISARSTRGHFVGRGDDALAKSAYRISAAASGGRPARETMPLPEVSRCPGALRGLACWRHCGSGISFCSAVICSLRCLSQYTLLAAVSWQSGMSHRYP